MNKVKPKIVTILSIETSCDETAAAVLKVDLDKAYPKITTLSSVIKSQIKFHSKMGGVVPEAAARAHVKNILPVVKKSLSAARCALKAIDYITVTQGPGLIPSLIVGVEFAKALSLAANIPLIPINHMSGHLYSPVAKIQNSIFDIQKLFPMVSLIVSGGHTMLVIMKNLHDYEVIGQTVDDAAGEAFDKIAKLLGLPYPGGPEVSKMAAQGTASIAFPRPMIYSKDFNFSFSGLKTAVLYFVKDQGSNIKNKKTISDICASFQAAAVDVLVSKTLSAAKKFGAKSVSLSGGVSANTFLRSELKAACKKNGLKLFIPDFSLSTDNAEMIGFAAAFKLQAGFTPKKPVTIQANPTLSL